MIVKTDSKIDISILNIIELKKEQLTEKQIRTILSLTLRGPSGMRDIWKEMEYFVSNIMDHNIFIAYYEDKIVGWGISVRRQWHAKEYENMVYVNRNFRKKGIGKALVFREKLYVKSKRKKFMAHVYDSQEFFNRCGITGKNSY